MTDPTNTPNPPPIAPSSPGSAQRLTASTAATLAREGTATRRTMTALLRILPTTLLPALLSCNADGTMPTLLDSEARGVSESEPMSEELKRLRKLQEVTWTKDDGTGPVTIDGAASNLVGSLATSCSPYSEGTLTEDHPCYIGENGFNIGGCGMVACADTHTYICTAHRALQVADSLTDVGYAYSDASNPNITIKVPPQSAGARIDLRREAAKEAKRALMASLGQLLQAQDSPLCAADKNDVADIRNSMESPFRGSVAGQVIAQQAVEALNLYREAIKSAAYESVNYADTFRSHPTYSQGVQASMAGEELSRAEAVHLLIGGAPGLDGHPGLCTHPNLTPNEQAIAEVIVDEGICADDFRGEIPEERIISILNSAEASGIITTIDEVRATAQAVDMERPVKSRF